MCDFAVILICGVLLWCRMAGSMDFPTKGGFSYDLCRRNDFLEKKGHKMPGFLKTGTTIVGLVFKVQLAFTCWCFSLFWN
jgi:hypothetical protein